MRRVPFGKTYCQTMLAAGVSYGNSIGIGFWHLALASNSLGGFFPRSTAAQSALVAVQSSVNIPLFPF